MQFNMHQEYRPNRFQILPPVVKNLLIINGIMYLATVVLEKRFQIDLADYLGLRYPTSDAFRPYQLITHLFMHGSTLHIFSNMFALWMFGNMLENVWGSKRFLIFYLVTGLGAAAVHLLFTGYEIMKMKEAIDLYASNVSTQDYLALFNKYKGYIPPGQISEQIEYYKRIYVSMQMSPGDVAVKQQSVEAISNFLQYKADIVTVGASGAVFGVLLAFGMLFPNTLLYLYFAIPVKAKYFVALYGLFELYAGFQNSPNDNVAHFAHLGGMLFGFILIKIWGKYNRKNFY